MITELLVRLEGSYDAIPRVRGAVAERLGPFELFVNVDGGWPFYARPGSGVTVATRSHVDAVRARQRALGVPEAFEWIHDLAPSVTDAIAASGLAVMHAPLMVLEPDRLPDPQSVAVADLVVLDPDAAQFPQLLAQSFAVAAVSFAAAGTSAGPGGPDERDAATAAPDDATVARAAASLRAGSAAEVVALAPGIGIAARGAYQTGAGAAEIVGVATLPVARRQGLGAAVSALLARHALDAGFTTVFLSAASEDVARVYARIGFRRVGTACIAEPGR